MNFSKNKRFIIEVLHCRLGLASNACYFEAPNTNLSLRTQHYLTETWPNVTSDSEKIKRDTNQLVAEIFFAKLYQGSLRQESWPTNRLNILRQTDATHNFDFPNRQIAKQLTIYIPQYEASPNKFVTNQTLQMTLTSRNLGTAKFIRFKQLNSNCEPRKKGVSKTHNSVQFLNLFGKWNSA